METKEKGKVFGMSTRFIITFYGATLFFILALYAISKRDGVTAPAIITAMGGVLGGYLWSRASTNNAYTESNSSQPVQAKSVSEEGDTNVTIN